MSDLEKRVKETPMNQIARIIEEEIPEVNNSTAFQCKSDPMSAVYHAIKNSGTETRRKIAKILFESFPHRPESYVIFTDFSTESECKTPVDGNKRYSAELDVTFEPEKAYWNLMRDGDYSPAWGIAVKCRLGNKLEDAAVLEQLQKDKSTGLREHYHSQKRLKSLHKEFGQSVARLYFSSLLNQESANQEDGFYDTKLFEEAKKVAEQANLGQEFVDKAEALRPSKLQRTYTWLKRLVTSNYPAELDNGVVVLNR